MEDKLTVKQKIQELEYEYPYHYIPVWKKGVFSQVQFWSWGMHYLAGIKIVLDQLDHFSFNSLVDIGCGDGRFLREVARRYPNVRLLGLDYSERAIRFAQVMNPKINYRVMNISEMLPLERFDVATMVEVLEHIPPCQIDRLLETVSNVIDNNGRLIITVPHLNKPVQNKHYQHFSSKVLKGYLMKHFRQISFIPFDANSKVMALFEQLIGGRGNNFIITKTQLTSWVFRLYINRFLYCKEERKCLRIAALCRK